MNSVQSNVTAADIENCKFQYRYCSSEQRNRRMSVYKVMTEIRSESRKKNWIIQPSMSELRLNQSPLYLPCGRWLFEVGVLVSSSTHIAASFDMSDKFIL